MNNSRTRQKCISKKFVLGLLIAMIVLINFLSCERNLTGPENIENDIIVREEQGKIKINNNSSETIGYTAFNSNVLPFILWAPICGEENTILPHQQKQFEPNELWNYEPGAEIIVYWWACPWKSENTENMFSKIILVH